MPLSNQFTVPGTFQTFTTPSVMEKVAAKVKDLFAGHPPGTQAYMERKSRDAIDRAQLTRAMPVELSGSLSLPEDERPLPSSAHGLYVKTPRLSYAGADARFSFCIPVEDASGKTRMRTAKHFMPLFEGADYSFRPGKLPPVLLAVGGEIQTVEGFVKTLVKSPGLLKEVPSAKVADVQTQEPTIQDLVREHGPHRKITTWALAEAAPQRFDVVKVGSELSLLDKQNERVYPSSVLEKAWAIAGLRKEQDGYVMTPAVALELPAEFKPVRRQPQPGMDI